MASTPLAIPSHPLCSGIYLLLARSGGRISEILGLRWADEVSPGIFLIRGSKKSRSYTIHFPASEWPQFQLCKGHTHLFGSMDRTTVWRTFKKAGIFCTPPGNKKRAVTHSLRHEFAKAVQRIDNDPKIIQDSMRHNSIKSQEYYLKHKPK